MLFILLVLLSVNIYADNKEPKPYRIGYTTQYSKGQYNSDYYIDNSEQSNTHSGSERRRSPKKPFDGDGWEDLEDYWRMNLPDWLGGDSNWPGYVDEDYWDYFFEHYGEEYGSYVESWFNDPNHPERQDLPNNPYKNPIGDMPIILFLFFILAITIKIALKNKERESKW